MVDKASRVESENGIDMLSTGDIISLFPRIKEVRHEMEATVEIGEVAELNYAEVSLYYPRICPILVRKK